MTAQFGLICELMSYSSQRGKAVLKNRVCYAAPALGALLVQATFVAQAFTLGDMRGAATIGRALDVNVQVQAGADETVSSACVTAEVLYADLRQSAVKVSVQTAGGTAAASTVRVQASSPVDEPVVTVLLRSTCGSTSLRRYVLLADFPVLAGAPAVVLPQSAVVDAALTAPIPTQAQAPSSARESSPAQRPPSGVSKPAATKSNAQQGAVKPKSAKAGTTTSATTQAHKVADRPTGKSVLKLDPLEILSDRIDSLDSVMLFAPTEDALRYSRQITTLEGDVKTLRALAASNDAKLSDMRAKLQQSQASQIPDWLLYGMAALLLACLGAVAWLWLQQRRREQDGAAQAWWKNSDSMAATEVIDPSLLPTARPVAPVPVEQVKPVVPQENPFAAEVKVVQPVPHAAADGHAVHDEGDDEGLHGSFDVSTSGAPFEINSIRHISVEPILDIRQQAEFFVSLGQTDRALHILKKQIGESSEPNPLVYLDLITLYHSLGMKADFRERRETFQQLFNGTIPDFPAFNLEGNGLDAYPEVLDELASLWPRIDALAFLSSCIFHEVGAQPRQIYDLAAFRDLLMLHALAEELVSESASGAVTAPGSLESRAAAPAQSSSEPVEEFPSCMLDLDFSDLADQPTATKAADAGAGVADRLDARASWLSAKKT